MSRSFLAALLVAMVIWGSSPVMAVIGTMDEVPAATLLLPYFEVDLSNPNGSTTVFTVTNASQHPVILHFSLWTDWSVATLNFNAYLTGYDVLEVDLRDLFVQGTFPGTSHNNPAVSPVGDFSELESAATGVGPGTADCDFQLPLPALPSTLLDHIQASHTGQPSAVFAGRCSGASFGDSVARGYLTVDNVDSCVLGFPTDAGYFTNGGAGDANNENVLLGSFRILNPNAGTGFGGAMAHLEASSDDPRTQPGNYTFYARYSGGADNREPLATTFFAPLVYQETEFLVWRDTKVPGSPELCGTAPSWFPLDSAQVEVFDLEENIDSTLPPPPPFPQPPPLIPYQLATTRVQVGSPTFPAIVDQGWVFTNLDVDTGGLPSFGDTAQAWMTVVSPFGLGVSQDAYALDNASDPFGGTLPCNPGAPPVGPPCSELPSAAGRNEGGDR